MTGPPVSTAAKVVSKVAGGQIRRSQPRPSAPALMAPTMALPSLSVPFIFQLPAISCRPLVVPMIVLQLDMRALADQGMGWQTTPAGL